MSVNRYLSPGPQVRRCHRCPACGFHASVHFAGAGEGRSLYRCMKLVGAGACGAYFTAPKPEPLRRIEPERREAA